ncbi:hypothetical protein Aph02nite_82340 [Actinoplanes philippinensis]|nr:hypothetical protein Aph02nite_82340 [Actinoplanes philippinensis]
MPPASFGHPQPAVVTARRSPTTSTPNRRILDLHPIPASAGYPPLTTSCPGLHPSALGVRIGHFAVPPFLPAGRSHHPLAYASRGTFPTLCSWPGGNGIGRWDGYGG